MTYHPPAGMGDIAQAVRDGYQGIGLVDGFFGDRLSVWHKEILHALNRGCVVLGAASMGALRAAECHPFGMRPVGVIAARYVSGDLIDDAAVALLHGPEETDYAPFTEPLVEALATIRALQVGNAIDLAEADALHGVAQRMHFTVRTLDAMLDEALVSPKRREDVAQAYERYRVRTKREDAILLLQELLGIEESPRGKPGWEVADSAAFRKILQS